MDEWAAELQRGRPETAWDRFLDRYRRLIFAGIRHYARDYDEVMDVFAHVCDALREDDLRRLRNYLDQPDHRASFSTWLVTVVRHLTIDWFRHRDGRRRLSTVAEALPPLSRRIFQHVFLDRRSHREAYELLRSGGWSSLTYREYLVELRATYAAVTARRRGMLFREVGVTPPVSDEAEAAEPQDYSDARELLDRALATLSAGDRTALELYVVEQLPAEDVARVTGLPNAKAVYNRVYRALAAVREWLEREGIRSGDL